MFSFLLILGGFIVFISFLILIVLLRDRLRKCFFAYLVNDSGTLEDMEEESRLYLNTAWDTNIDIEQNINQRSNLDVKLNDSSTNIRLEAIKKAQPYIETCNGDIWHNINLENEYCRASLGDDGIGISVLDKTDMTYSRYFEIVFNNDTQKSVDVWNDFCFNFNENTNYQEMVEYCVSKAIKIQRFGENSIKPLEEEVKSPKYSNQLKKQNTIKIDDNSERNLDL